MNCTRRHRGRAAVGAAGAPGSNFARGSSRSLTCTCTSCKDGDEHVNSTTGRPHGHRRLPDFCLLLSCAQSVRACCRRGPQGWCAGRQHFSRLRRPGAHRNVCGSVHGKRLFYVMGSEGRVRRTTIVRHARKGGHGDTRAHGRIAVQLQGARAVVRHMQLALPRHCWALSFSTARPTSCTSALPAAGNPYRLALLGGPRGDVGNAVPRMAGSSSSASCSSLGQVTANWGAWLTQVDHIWDKS